MFFENPKQVKFWDSADEDYCSGIAYHDEIICGCCGSVFEIKDIIDEAAEDGIENAIIPFGFWVDLTAEIAGDQ